MKPRFRFRVRTYLIAIALMGIPLYGAAEIWRQGGLYRFRVHHAMRAYSHRGAAVVPRRVLESYSKHLSHRVPCPSCPSLARPIEEVGAYHRRLLRDAEWRAWWHELLAGPVRIEGLTQ